MFLTGEQSASIDGKSMGNGPTLGNARVGGVFRMKSSSTITRITSSNLRHITKGGQQSLMEEKNKKWQQQQQYTMYEPHKALLIR